MDDKPDYEPYLLTETAFIPVIRAIFSDKYKHIYAQSSKIDLSSESNRYKPKRSKPNETRL